MQRRDIKVGGVYEVRIGTALTEAVVNRIDGGVVFVTDTATHRRHQFKNVSKFRSFLRMNAPDPDAARKELEVMKPLEEYQPPSEGKVKDLEPERNRMRKARRLLEEVKELVQYQDITSRVDGALQRVTKVLFSLDGPGGKKPYVTVEVDPEDVEEHRGSLKDIDSILKRVAVGGGKGRGRSKAMTSVIQLVSNARSRIGEVDRYLLGLIQSGKRKEGGEGDEETEVVVIPRKSVKVARGLGKSSPHDEEE